MTDYTNRDEWPDERLVDFLRANCVSFGCLVAETGRGGEHWDTAAIVKDEILRRMAENNDTGERRHV